MSILRGVTPGYFGAAGVPLVAGRGFDSHDTAASRHVAVVDEQFARALTASGSVIGRKIRWLRQPDMDIEIVGVVGAVRHRGPADEAAATVYRPTTQYPRRSMYFVVRTNGDTAELAKAVTAAIGAISRAHPVADVATMAERLARVNGRATASLMLAGALAALALTLAAVGLYGVISFRVSQRRREFAVRLALGASPAAVRHMVIRGGLAIVAAGVVAGSTGGWIVARTASSLLFEVTASDLTPYVLSTAVVFACAVVAFSVPAQRASRVDAVTTLRSD